MNMSRTEALRQIISFGEQRELAYAVLVSFPFDCEVELLEVKKLDLAFVLNKLLTNEITTDDLEMWANFIECREDLNYEEIEDYIYALANPELVGELDLIKIKKMVQFITIL
jgi:hypothetical protein